MKTIPLIPACQNMEELRKLTDLICGYVHPQMVILFGHYAGMSLSNVLKGYEMLVVTKDKPATQYRELLNYLNQHYCVEDRIEKNLVLHVYTLDFVRYKSVQSYFLTTIRREGVLLYQDNTCKLADRIRYKPVRAYQLAEKNYKLGLELGKEFLQDAQRHFETGTYRLTTFYLYQAALQFIRAVTYVYYGFISEEKEDLITSFSKIRYCSEGLAHIWLGEGELAAWRLFGRLQSFNFQARFSERFRVQGESLLHYFEHLRLLQKATEEFCTERIDFLMQNQHL